jgi:predicted phage terminase large subunit-like protein
MSSVIWSVIGKLQKKFIVIMSLTQSQAKQHLRNVKIEFESNLLLRKDFGEIQEVTDEWGSFSLFLPKYNAKIIAVSTEQSIRGIRHMSYRPDYIIGDDIEDQNAVKTRESRDNTYNWFKGEIISLGDENTKIILIGNLLHEDSLLMRVKKEIQEGALSGIVREYPFMNEHGVPLWKSRFPDSSSIEKLKVRIGDEKTWQREYMLKIIPDADQIIKKEWIHYWDVFPIDRKDFRYSVLSVDPAISEQGDYTAMVIIHIFGRRSSLKIFVDANIVNKRLNFPDSINLIKNLAVNNKLKKNRLRICIESVAFQRSIVQRLEENNFKAHALSVGGMNKRERLASVSMLFSQGKILFPSKGAEQLIQQLLYLGVEKHDDLCDAMTLGLNYILSQDTKEEDECILSWA